MAPLKCGDPELSLWAEGIIKQTEVEWRRACAHPAGKAVAQHGFKVFYSPVRAQPDVLVLGEQPGGGPSDFCLAVARQLPEGHEYFHSNYLLARKMRHLFAREPALLERSVKLNLNFCRSPSREAWHASTPATVRDSLLAFCTRRVVEIIDRLAPRVILCEGILPFDALQNHPRMASRVLPTERGEVRGRQGERLYIRRQLASGTQLMGMAHPTGAHVSSHDRERITTALWADLGVFLQESKTMPGLRGCARGQPATVVTLN